METVPAKVERRLVEGLRRFQPIIEDAAKRELNEADTVRIVTDLLAELFGYNKYTEITGEQAIGKTVCDLVLKVDEQRRLVVEVKSIGLTAFKEAHVRQAVDYAAREDMDWAVLTNGRLWRVFRVHGRPLSEELVVSLDLLGLSPRSASDVARLFPLTKEAMARRVLEDVYLQHQATDPFHLAALILHDDVLMVLRRELRRRTADIKVAPEDLRRALVEEVLRRDVTEGDEAAEAAKWVRGPGKPLRARRGAGTDSGTGDVPGAAVPPDAVGTTETSDP